MALFPVFGLVYVLWSWCCQMTSVENLIKLVCIDILALLFAFELLRQFDGSRAPTTIVSASARVTHGSLRLWLPGLTLFKLVLHLWQFPQPAGSNKKTAVAAHTREIMAPPFDAADLAATPRALRKDGSLRVSITWRLGAPHEALAVWVTAREGERCTTRGPL